MSPAVSLSIAIQMDPVGSIDITGDTSFALGLEALHAAGVVVRKVGGGEVDGKSIISVMTLGAQLGDEIEIVTDGAGATEALEALSDLVRKDFHGV